MMIKKAKSKKISSEERAEILNFLLESVQGLPIKNLITYDSENNLQVDGKILTPEQHLTLREGASALERNAAYKIIRDQVTYEAIKMGVHSSVSIEMLLMSKAAIWIYEQEKKWITNLTNEVV